MNVLVIAPHPDDECIGCGGTICLHADRGDFVSAVFLTSGELGLKHLPKEKAWQIREREAERAGKILGIAESHFLRGRDWFLSEETDTSASALAPILQRLQPELIYFPHEKEWHPDHQAALPVVRAALQSGRIFKTELRGYEVWTPLSDFDQVENISETMPRKLKALRCHRSQLGEFDYAAAIRGLNRYRGVMAGKCRFAEVFAAAPPA